MPSSIRLNPLIVQTVVDEGRLLASSQAPSSLVKGQSTGLGDC